MFKANQINFAVPNLLFLSCFMLNVYLFDSNIVLIVDKYIFLFLFFLNFIFDFDLAFGSIQELLSSHFFFVKSNFIMSTLQILHWRYTSRNPLLIFALFSCIWNFLRIITRIEIMRKPKYLSKSPKYGFHLKHNNRFYKADIMFIFVSWKLDI